AGSLAGEPPRCTAEAHRVTSEAQEGDKSRARRLAAIRAIAMPHHGRFALGLVANRAAQAPAGVSELGVGHRPIIVAAPVAGKFGRAAPRTARPRAQRRSIAAKPTFWQRHCWSPVEGAVLWRPVA